MNDEATLFNLLTADEKKSALLHAMDISNRALRYLTAEDLNKLFLIVKLRIASNGYLPAGYIVSMVWEELSLRAIEQEFTIF